MISRRCSSQVVAVALCCANDRVQADLITCRQPLLSPGRPAGLEKREQMGRAERAALPDPRITTQLPPPPPPPLCFGATAAAKDHQSGGAMVNRWDRLSPGSTFWPLFFVFVCADVTSRFKGEEQVGSGESSWISVENNVLIGKHELLPVYMP